MIDLRDILEREYRACGFGAAGAVPFLEPVEEDREHLEQWLAKGYGEGLGYLERSKEYRHDLRRLMPEVESVVVTLTSYNRGDLKQAAGIPKIARYAWGMDYHDVIRQNLWGLLGRIRKYEGFENMRGKAVVDSSSTFEKAWAVRAGLGWRGQNSLLVNPELGSYVMIGMLLLDREIPEREIEMLKDGCGACRRCVEACPNEAIQANGEERVIDIRRCISHWTQSVGGDTRGWVWGCDICLEACPYNRTQTALVGGMDSPLAVRPELMHISREEWLAMTREEYRERFKATALDRKGLERIKSLLL